MQRFRIYGDNVIECERLVRIIIRAFAPEEIKTSLVSPSVINVESNKMSVKWHFELFPGFNKSTKNRWPKNIFAPLKAAGSFFDETPDVVISEIDERNQESILLAIEFCSALQAGNQAWQRSARAFSLGRTGCPYLYIVDFVKYELDNETRKRKNLRFPNAAVPYSYINYSKATNNFIAQLYTKSEEFNKDKDSVLTNFDEENFGGDVLGTYILKTLLHKDTSEEKKKIIQKNIHVVQFLAQLVDKRSNLTAEEWSEISALPSSEIIDYIVRKHRFGFHKTIAEKSSHGHTTDFVNIIDKFSIGFASKELPFGIIPADNRSIFSEELGKLYPNFSKEIISAIGDNTQHLIIAIFKGFKPRGDDNRPDRGLLPLISMLSTEKTPILTFIYGPLLEKNLVLLDTNPQLLAQRNGLWHTIIALSDFICLDAPVLTTPERSIQKIYDNRLLKKHCIQHGTKQEIAKLQSFANTPVSFGEDDVDTALHYLFAHVLHKSCFESMCNPPGGDWSGFSILHNGYENRWVSLPRVSEVVSGKRPDHIIQMFGVFSKPLLLAIESKEKSVDLEKDVGIKLIAYIKNIMQYIPSSKRQIHPILGNWEWGNAQVGIGNFEFLSAAAYLKKYAENPKVVFNKKCDMLFVLQPMSQPNKIKWEIEILTQTKQAKIVKDFIIQQHKNTGNVELSLK